VQADGKIAQLIRAKRMDPVKISGMLAKAITAALNSVMKFTAKPPLIHEGIKNLGKDLLDAFDPLLDPKENPNSGLNKQAYDKFKTKWNEHFDNLPDALASIETDIRKFTDDGDAVALIEAIETIMDSANDAVLMFLPQETSKEVDKFMTAATGVVDAIGKSWKEFQDGKVEQGTEKLYFNLRGVIDELIPAEIRNNTEHVYNTVTGTIDGVMAQLTTKTFAYRKGLLERSVCYRSNLDSGRPSQPAAACPEDWIVIEQGHKRGCKEKGAVLLQVNETLDLNTEMVDRAAKPKGEQKVDGSTAKKDFGDNSKFAACDETSAFFEYHSHQCYGHCPDGYHPEKKECRIDCDHNFPAKSADGKLCGKSEGQIVQWIIQLAMTIAMALSQIIQNVASLVKNLQDKLVYSSDDVPKVTDTLAAFVDMGLAFANKYCDKVMTK